MKRYRFLRDIIVDLQPFQAGQVVSEKDIPFGSLASLLRCGNLEPVEEPAEAPPPAKPAKAK